MQISIVVRCSVRFTEVVLDEPENTEFFIEECVSRALLELFDVVIVEMVKISDTSPEHEFDDVPSYGG